MGRVFLFKKMQVGREPHCNSLPYGGYKGQFLKNKNWLEVCYNPNSLWWKNVKQAGAELCQAEAS